MPEFVWIGIMGAGTLVLLCLLIMLALGKVKIRSRWVSLMPHSSPTAAQIVDVRQVVSVADMNAMVQYTDKMVGAFHAILYGTYLRLLSDRGANRDYLIEYESSQLVSEIAQTLTRSGNGVLSVQQILEKHLLSLEWLGNSIDTYVRERITPAITETCRRRLNERYKSEYRTEQDELVKRLVSNTDFVDAIMLPAFSEQVTTFVLPFFRFASDCAKRGCSDEENER